MSILWLVLLTAALGIVLALAIVGLVCIWRDNRRDSLYDIQFDNAGTEAPEWYRCTRCGLNAAEAAALSCPLSPCPMDRLL